MKSVLFLLLSAGVAFGHPGDPSPFPGTSELWAVPGVVHTAKLATVVTCTNVHFAPVTVGVEVFDDGGFSLGSTAVNLSPGLTANFSTTSLGSPTPVLSLPNAPATVDVPEGTYGMLRVLSASRKVVCSAMLIDRVSNPASTINGLPIIHKLKEHGG